MNKVWDLAVPEDRPLWEELRIPPLRSPGFPVEVGGVGEVPAAFFEESRIHGFRWLGEVGNPGTLRSELVTFLIFRERTGAQDCPGFPVRGSGHICVCG